MALSWTLRGDLAGRTQLLVRPFFSGCGPRSYRDTGFEFDSEEDGGRLTWLPTVRGPKIVADTNGQYRDEPIQLPDWLCEQAAASASEEDLITPGCFEFELSRRPSVLIFSMEGDANIQRDHDVGAFLAGLMQRNASARRGVPVIKSAEARIQQLAAA